MARGSGLGLELGFWVWGSCCVCVKHEAVHTGTDARMHVSPTTCACVSRTHPRALCTSPAHRPVNQPGMLGQRRWTGTHQGGSVSSNHARTPTHSHTHAHTLTHARPHTQTRMPTHARTHAHILTHARVHTQAEHGGGMGLEGSVSPASSSGAGINSRHGAARGRQVTPPSFDSPSRRPTVFDP